MTAAAREVLRCVDALRERVRRGRAYVAAAKKESPALSRGGVPDGTLWAVAVEAMERQVEEWDNEADQLEATVTVCEGDRP